MLARDLGDVGFLVMCLAQLALVAGQQADDEARQQYVNELRPWLGQNRLFGYGMPIFLVLGQDARVHGDLDDARSYLQEAIRMRRLTNSPYMEPAAQSELAHLARQTGDLTGAGTLYRQTPLKWANLGYRAAITNQLECLAFIARAEDLPERAARLLGVAEALREAGGAPMVNCERTEYERELAAVRAQLDPHACAAAWSAGRELTMEQSVAYALETKASAQPA